MYLFITYYRTVSSRTPADDRRCDTLICFWHGLFEFLYSLNYHRSGLLQGYITLARHKYGIRNTYTEGIVVYRPVRGVHAKQQRYKKLRSFLERFSRDNLPGRPPSPLPGHHRNEFKEKMGTRVVCFLQKKSYTIYRKKIINTNLHKLTLITCSIACRSTVVPF